MVVVVVVALVYHTSLDWKNVLYKLIKQVCSFHLNPGFYVYQTALDKRGMVSANDLQLKVNRVRFFMTWNQVISVIISLMHNYYTRESSTNVVVPI